MTEADRARIEAAAIRARYDRRDPAATGRHDPFRPDVLLRAQARERALLRLFADRGVRPLDAKSVLEIGCGEGINLLQLVRLGFDPARLVGNDLRLDALAAAARILPASVRLLPGEASGLDLGAETFDIVMQSTVFSSILDPAVQEAVARRMWALTKPGGAVLWYDFVYDNPKNADVRGVPLARVRALFPAASVTAQRLTLAPPLARPLAAAHPSLYALFDAIPWLRSHVLCWLAKP
jgi:SAM-dependent methyltransferase